MCSLLYGANVACLSPSLSFALCILSGFDVFELGSVTKAQTEGLLSPQLRQKGEAAAVSVGEQLHFSPDPPVELVSNFEPFKGETFRNFWRHFRVMSGIPSYLPMHRV